MSIVFEIIFLQNTNTRFFWRLLSQKVYFSFYYTVAQ